MGLLLIEQETLIVWQETVIWWNSPNWNYNVFFEDDTLTWYFYWLDNRIDENPIVDAMHIYNSKDVADWNMPSEIKIIWSDDNRFWILMINWYVHAFYDFLNKNWYCRTGFPPPSNKSDWSINWHDWDEEIFNSIK